jgi:hypothetical protein
MSLFRLFLIAFSAMLLISSCTPDFTQSDLELVQSQIDEGYFIESREFIHDWLNSEKSISSENKKNLEFELERMRRIERDFSLDRNETFEKLAFYIHDLTEEEFEEFDAQNLLEKMWIDGKMMYFRSAASNLFYISEEAKARLSEPKKYFLDDAVLYRTHPHHEAVIQTAEQTKQRFVLPKKIKIRYSLTVNENVVPDGEILKVWIPFPREIDHRQTDIKYTNSEPKKHSIASNKHLQRTIYFEKPAKKDQKTEFWVEYDYTSQAEYVYLTAENVLPLKNPKSFKEYLGERLPHIRFTEDLKEKSLELIGNETNPFLIADKLFTYVDSIPWASAIEYSTIRNISDYAFNAGHADCGQVSLLLMTLFRMNGIPTKWQSGWEFSDTDFDTMHDWFLAYFEPFGWVPVDVTHGKLSSENPQIRNFYLGGIDSYRLVFNDDYSQKFDPAKKFYRSETVDSQRGEVEWKGGNLYFDKWRYSMKWEITDAPQAQ